MSQKLVADLPNDLDLGVGYTLQWTAVDPTTGAAVTGVTMSNAYLLVNQLTPGGAEALINPVTPLWVPVPLTDVNVGG